MINYLILPIINIVVSFFYIVYPSVDLKEQSIESYVIFILIVCISRVIEYFVQIRRTVVLDARIYLQTKAEIESQSPEQLTEQLITTSDLYKTDEDKAQINIRKEILGEKTPYLTRDRGYGQGDVRVGSALELGEDIYSLGFIA